MAPFPIEVLFGKFGAYLVYLLIGFAFGAVLEMAGFAHSPKLAAQFYFKDLTVLKVMFTAIVVAMVLIFLSSGLMLLDYSRLWVNPTYLWPGILGGLIMGFGFIIGGFCPGTSLVALATLRLDGLFFALGALTGIFIFGESVQHYAALWNSTFLGRLTLPAVFGISTGWVVVLVVLMALFMFWGGEQLERIFGKSTIKPPKWRIAAGTGLLTLALLTLLIGQPSAMDKWNAIAGSKQELLDNREVQIHPGELLDLMHDDNKNLVLLDFRDESDYNQFHIRDAKHIAMQDIDDLAIDLLNSPANTVIVTICNNEVRSTEAWKELTALSVPNVYILEGGINHWLDIFGHEGHEQCTTAPVPGDESMRHIFNSALGEKQPGADPDLGHEKLDYTPKVKLETRVKRQGGCG